MTGGTFDCDGKMDLQQTEMFGANYAGGNHHIVAWSKNELSFLSINSNAMYSLFSVIIALDSPKLICHLM